MSNNQSKNQEATTLRPSSQQKENKRKSQFSGSFILDRILLNNRFATEFEQESAPLSNDKKRKREAQEKKRHPSVAIHRFLYAFPARSLGFFILCFGLGLLFFYFIGSDFFNVAPHPFGNLISAIVAILLGMTLLPFSSPFSSLLSESRLLSFILCDILLMKRVRLSASQRGRAFSPLCSVFSAFLGFALSFASLLVSGAMIWGILLLLTFVYCVFTAPECCLVIAAFILPFLSFFQHPTLIIAGLTLLLILSFFCKVLLKKRTLMFSLPDFLVLILGVLYLLGGFTGLGSDFYRSEGTLYALLIFVYFPAANLLKNRRVLFHTVASLLSSGLIVAVFGIYQYFKTPQFVESLDSDMLRYIDGRIHSFFLEGPNVLAVYLVLIIPFSLYLLVRNRRISSVAASLIPAVLLILSLIYTWSRGAWIGAAIAFLIFVFLSFRKRPTILLAVGAGVPFFLLLLPTSVYFRFASIADFYDTSISYRLSTWRGAFDLMCDFPFTGVGAGTASFRDAFLPYALPGTENVEHSHNLLLEMGIELGVLAPIIFLGLIVVLVLVTFARAICCGKNDLRQLQIAALTSIVGALIYGGTDYIFYNYRMVFLFFLIVGLLIACARSQTEDLFHQKNTATETKEAATADIVLKK